MTKSSLLLTTLAISLLAGLVSSMNISMVAVESGPKDNKQITISCHAPRVTDCQFRFYNYTRQRHGDIHACRKDNTSFYWDEGKEASCISGNNCAIKLRSSDVNGGRYVVGCRAKSNQDGGDWMYNFTTMYYFNKTVYLHNLEEGSRHVAQLGQRTSFLCPYREVGEQQNGLLRCRFSLPINPSNDHANFNQGPYSSNTSHYAYYGSGLQNGNYECGIQLASVREKNNGVVWCRVKFKYVQQDDVTAFALIVAKSPSTATVTLRPGREANTVRATCSVSASRPVAQVTWLLNGQQIREDGINDLRTDSWYWPWDQQPVVQSQILNSNDKFECKVRHENQTIPVTTAEYVKLESWQMKFDHKELVVTTKSKGTIDLKCKADQAIAQCGFRISNGQYYDITNMTNSITDVQTNKWQKSEVTDLGNGMCGLSFTAGTSGATYRIGCRGRTKTSGWKYAYTTLVVQNDHTCELTSLHRNEAVISGENVNISCKALKTNQNTQCRIIISNPEKDSSNEVKLCNYNRTKIITPACSRCNCHNKKPSENICGVTINNVTEADNGVIELEIVKPFYTKTAVYFSVAKPPQDVFLYVMKDGQYQIGDSFEAYCSAYQSRPPAKITWYLDSNVINDRSSDVMIEEVLDDKWRWTINATDTTQRLTMMLSESDDGKNLSCVVSHVALKENVTKFSYITIAKTSPYSSPQTTTVSTDANMHHRSDSDPIKGTSTVIAVSVAAILLVCLFVAAVVYSRVTRKLCFAGAVDQPGAAVAYSKGAAGASGVSSAHCAVNYEVPLYAEVDEDYKKKKIKELPTTVNDEAPVYAEVNKDKKKKKIKELPKAVNDEAPVYAEVNKDKKKKKELPNAVNDEAPVYAEVDKDRKKKKIKELPMTVNDEAPVYAEVNKDNKKKKIKEVPKTVNIAAPVYPEVNRDNKKKKMKELPGTVNEEEAAVYAVVNKDKQKKKTKDTPGAKSTVDDSVIYAEIAQTNPGRMPPSTASQSKARQEESVEYTPLNWK